MPVQFQNSCKKSKHAFSISKIIQKSKNKKTKMQKSKTNFSNCKNVYPKKSRKYYFKKQTKKAWGVLLELVPAKTGTLLFVGICA